MAAPLKRIRFTITPLSQYCAPNAQQLYIDGVAARINVIEARDQAGSGFQLLIDGVGGRSFMTSDLSDKYSPSYSIEFPPMRDECNRLIRYDQRLRISAGNLDPAFVRGHVIIFYEVYALPETKAEVLG